MFWIIKQTIDQTFPALNKLSYFLKSIHFPKEKREITQNSLQNPEKVLLDGQWASSQITHMHIHSLVYTKHAYIHVYDR